VFKNIPEAQERLLALGFPDSIQSLAVCSEILYTALDAYDKEFFFILDDVHILSSKAVTQFILFFAKDIPSNAHIILMSRNQIFNEAERLELGHKLYELSFHDLSLEKEELYEYAQLCGLDASKKELCRSSETIFCEVLKQTCHI
jgi:LuxR family maltose regulon positive regulatory protein